MKELLSTREVAKFLDINEKMVYSLISEKGLPATKITGKWLFPKHLVEQWIEANTINYPEPSTHLPPYHGLLIIAGSNDPLLEKAITLFNQTHTDHVAVFGNLGSMGGLRALRRDLCHMASSHLLQEDEEDYNFAFASQELDRMPAVINFCRREQGILMQKGNPRGIASVADFARPGLRMVNRPLNTGTRLLFDRPWPRRGSAVIRSRDTTGRFPSISMWVLKSSRIGRMRRPASVRWPTCSASISFPSDGSDTIF